MVSMTVATPADFRFKATVLSHGWYQLQPFDYDADNNILRRPYRLADGKRVVLNIRGARMRSILIDVDGLAVLTSRHRNQIADDVRHMFNLHRDLTAFYKQMRQSADYVWVDTHKAARMLSAPTVWEDLSKTLMTTNTAWSNTREMARKFANLDPDAPFPSPQTVAALSVDDLAEQVGLGYRGAYLHELATRITAGEIDPETWRALDSDDLYKAVTDLTGFGDYAAGTVMRLLGHYDKLAIDTVARKAYERVTGSAPDSDTDIRDYYEKYGEWRGLVLWMDCIRDEYDDAPQPDA